MTEAKQNLEVKEFDFNNDNLLGVRDDDGVIWLGVRRTCECIGLSRRQIETERNRVQSDDVLSKGTRTLCLPTNGGNQDAICIKEDFVNLWLAKIPMDQKKKKNQPDVYEKLVKYQLECADVLHEYFMGTEDKKQKFLDEMGIKGEIEEMKGLIVEQNNNIIYLKDRVDSMSNTLIFKQYTNPTHKFEALLTQFAIFYNLSSNERYRKLYDALDNWMGIKLPRDKRFSTKEYILQNIDISIIECFVNGIINKRIIKNKQGNYIDLNGVFANPVELDKIKNEFDNECAYCGASGITLIAEHILPKRHEKSTDLIYNIIPACSDCNQSKGENPLKEWYGDQEFCTKDRAEKINEHWKEYRVYE